MTNDERSNLETLLRNHTRRLYALQQRKALMGISTPPEVAIEIEDLEQIVAKLKREIAALPPPDPRSEATETGRQPPPLDQRQVNQLVELLLACPSMADQASRNTVVQQLPPAIANAIPRSSHTKIDVLNIVTTCRNYGTGIETLVEVVRFFDGGTVQMQRLDDFFA